MSLAYVIRADAIEDERRRTGGDPQRMDVSRVLRLEKVELPAVGHRSVRARVLAASVEHNVVHAALADTVNIAALRGGMMVPGNCFIGEVLETGDHVRGCRTGDIVVSAANSQNDRFGYPLRAWAYDEPGTMGCYSEEVVVDERQLQPAPLDAGLNLWELAASPLRAATAYHLWRRGHQMFRVKVPEEKLPRLNVLAFGGGTSEFFLMLAHSRGHRAIYCSGNAERRARLQEIGIESIEQEAFDRFSTPVDVRNFARAVRRRTGGDGAHVVCDMLRGPVFAAGLAALARQGVSVSAGWQLDMQVAYNSADLSLRQITIDHSHFETVEGCAAALSLLGEVFRPNLHKEIYAFGDLPRALEDLHRNRHTGIAVVRCAEQLPESLRGLVPGQ